MQVHWKLAARSSVQRFLGLLFFSSSLLASTPKQSCQLSNVDMAEIGAALGKPECRNSGYLDNVPDIPGKESLTFSVQFTPKPDAVHGKARTQYAVRQVAQADAEWVKKEIEQLADSKIPKDSCDDISRGYFSYSLPGNGTLVADVDVHYQKNACGQVPCITGWGSALGIPYPEFGMCPVKTNVTGAYATVGVHTIVTSQIVEQTPTPGFPPVRVIQVRADSTSSPKEGPSELVKNIVGFFTFGIGSKAIQDAFDHELGDFKASLTPQFRTVGLLHLPQGNKQAVEITFEPEPPYFSQGNVLKFGIAQSTNLDPELACKVKNEALKARKYFYSCMHPQTEYVVQNGDSLWRIANGLYGDGQFYHVISSLNHVSQKHQNLLCVGSALKVPPYYKLAGDDQVVVTAGDSLWQIAQVKLGNPLLYHKLLEENRDRIQDPRKLNTLMPIKIGSK
jgi:nucleoid-associated protein YgaU